MGLSPSVPLLFRRPPRGRRKSVLRRLAVAVRRSLSSAVLRTWSSSPRLRPPRGLRKSILFSSSASLSREVKMLAIAIATAALLAFSATAEAAITKYDYGGRESYKNEDYDSYDLHGAYGSDYMRRYDHGHEAYEAEDYHNDPFYESHFADRDYRDPHHDSYDEDHYSGDAYFEEPSFAYAKRYKRAVQDEMAMDKMGVVQDTREVQCSSRSGSRCIPAGWDGRILEVTCVNLRDPKGDKGKPWCATRVDSEGVLTNWAYCRGCK